MPSLDWFINRKRKEADWIIGNWLTRGNTGFILGQPKKANKSWLILGAIWDLARALPVWGYAPLTLAAPKPISSVYFAQEDTADNLQDRILILAKSRPVPSGVHIIPKDLSFSIDVGPSPIIEAIKRETKGAPVDLVCFDPMRRMYHGDENDSATIARIWRTLDKIHSTFNCATLFSHHIVKPPRDDDSDFDYSDPYIARGSGDIFGGGDSFINVMPMHKDAHLSRVQLFFESKRSAPPEPVILDISYDNGTMRPHVAEKPVQGRPFVIT